MEIQTAERTSQYPLYWHIFEIMPPLAGKHVLVIGGSSGIGFGVACAALAEGARITIASSSEAKLSAAVTRLNGGDAVHGMVLDVGQESEVKTFFEKVDTVDHLVFSVRIISCTAM